jgi:hypothetical protein
MTSCAGKGYGTNPPSDNYLYTQFTSLINNNTNIVTPKSTKNCRKYKGFYPSFTPTIISLSVTSSVYNTYSLVYISGTNFLPNGITFVKFGDVGYLPVTYYSSFNLSFIIPLNTNPGNYEVQVINIYNGNFSLPVNQSYPGNINFSNKITYQVIS